MVSNTSDGTQAEQCFHNTDPLTSGETRVFACPCGMYGRYVRIQFPVDVEKNMALCEVQIQSEGENKNCCRLNVLLHVY